MKKLLPIVLLLIGSGAGVAAGIYLRPVPEPKVVPETEEPAMAEKAISGPRPEGPESGREYVKLTNQFVVPVVKNRVVVSLVVLSLSLEVSAGARESVFAAEPKLRAGFLAVLFDHANHGGFDGAFTSAANLRTLRVSLAESARAVLGGTVRDVLITDMMRQDT